MTDNQPTPPITVKASAAGDLAWQAVRALVIAASAAAAMKVFNSEMVAGLAVAAATATVAAIPAVVAYLFGVITTLRTHREKKVMAQQLPNSVATVKP